MSSVHETVYLRLKLEFTEQELIDKAIEEGMKALWLKFMSKNFYLSAKVIVRFKGVKNS
jgi:hypothetical protein